MTREEKVRAVAKAFMDDDTSEYAGETVEDIVFQISQLDDRFIDTAYEWFCAVNLH